MISDASPSPMQTSWKYKQCKELVMIFRYCREILIEKALTKAFEAFHNEKQAQGISFTLCQDPPCYYVVLSVHKALPYLRLGLPMDGQFPQSHFLLECVAQ